jgi:hypothetical protein
MRSPVLSVQLARVGPGRMPLVMRRENLGRARIRGAGPTVDHPIFREQSYHALSRHDTTRWADLGAYQARSSTQSQSDDAATAPVIIYTANARTLSHDCTPPARTARLRVFFGSAAMVTAGLL